MFKSLIFNAVNIWLWFPIPIKLPSVNKWNKNPFKVSSGLCFYNLHNFSFSLSLPFFLLPIIEQVLFIDLLTKLKNLNSIWLNNCRNQPCLVIFYGDSCNYLWQRSTGKWLFHIIYKKKAFGIMMPTLTWDIFQLW